MQVDLKIQAQLKEIDRVCAQVDQLLTQKGLQELSFCVQLMVREALTNAIQHGAGLDRNKFINFSFYQDKEKLRIRVEDPGPGFDWIAQEKNNFCEFSENGRGICIMRQYSDYLAFNKAGNELTLVKKLER